jgi:hypothetical protein
MDNRDEVGSTYDTYLEMYGSKDITGKIGLSICRLYEIMNYIASSFELSVLIGAIIKIVDNIPPRLCTFIGKNGFLNMVHDVLPEIFYKDVDHRFYLRNPGNWPRILELLIMIDYEFIADLIVKDNLYVAERAAKAAKAARS